VPIVLLTGSEDHIVDRHPDGSSPVIIEGTIRRVRFR
jgi:hypothetical protein